MLLLLASLAPAHAQTRSPEITSLALPLALTTTLERDTDHGCSQSFESVAARATVRLAIDATSAAQLVLDGRYARTSGPSPGRYAAGDHDISQLTELHRATWSGHATILPDGIVLAFDRVERAEARFTGYGTMPLGAPRAQATTARMRCSVTRNDVFPAVEAVGEHPASVALVTCAWLGPSDPPFDRYLDDADAAPFVLGAGPGVRDRLERTMGSYETQHQVRLLP